MGLCVPAWCERWLCGFCERPGLLVGASATTEDLNNQSPSNKQPTLLFVTGYCFDTDFPLIHDGKASGSRSVGLMGAVEGFPVVLACRQLMKFKLST